MVILKNLWMDELEKRGGEINIIKVMNFIEKVPKVDDDELYSLGHEKEAISEARRRLKEHKSNKDIERDQVIKKEKLREVYNNIRNILLSFMDMPEDQVRVVTTWIIGTYFHEVFNTYPFLFINSMRGSGKTRLLRIISHLSAKSSGEVQSGLSEAVLFRTPTGHTLVLDEIEGIGSKEKAVLREYLNACYKSGGTVKRTKKSKNKEGESWDVETFRPYKPIAMANIWGMDEVLGDRCLTFILEKSNNPGKTKKVENFENNETFLEIKRTLEDLVLFSVVLLRKKNIITAWNNYIDVKYNNIHTYTQQTTHNNINNINNINNKILYDLFEKIDSLNIDGRNFELLFPLLLVSDLLGEDHIKEMLRIGKDMIESKKSDELAESKDVSVYQFVSNQSSSLGLVAIKELTQKFKIFVGEDEWINEKWLGRALKRLNLILDSKRMASGKFVMLNIAKASEKSKIFGRGGE